jgi:hypothetical protein
VPKKINGEESNSPVVRVEAKFVRLHEKRYGFKPIVSYGRDRSLLKKLIEQWGEEATSEMVDAFFAATWPGGIGYQEIRRMRWHNIQDFYQGAQIIRRLQQSGGELQDRSAANAHEIAKAMGKKP